MGVSEVVVFFVVSEVFNCKNINVLIDELIECFLLVLECVKVDGVKVCGYVFIVFGCLY